MIRSASRPLTPQPLTSRRGLATLIAALLAITLAAAACSSTESEDAAGETTTTFATGTVHRFVIPAGTGDAIDGGETVDIMPDRLDIKVGDAVEIVNQDDRGHNVGLFFVGVGETVNQVFPSVAEFSDVCSVSATGTFTINVT